MDSIEELLAIEHEWAAAHRNGDFATMERLMADDFVKVLPDGSLANKAEVLASLRDQHRSWYFAAGDEYDVRILGDAAVVIGRWRGRGSNNGQPFDYSARFSSIYVRRDGRWLMLTEQSTTIIPPNVEPSS